MLNTILSLINNITDFFKPKPTILGEQLQSTHSVSVFWLTILEAVLVFLLLWNGVIVPNTHWPEIQTTFDATDLLKQLIGVSITKHVVKHWK